MANFCSQENVAPSLIKREMRELKMMTVYFMDIQESGDSVGMETKY